MCIDSKRKTNDNKVMKANEAPEKIYLFENPIDETPDYRWLSKKSCDEDIEYTRTDAFVEKACAWLENNLQGIAGGSIYIEDFRKYMVE